MASEATGGLLAAQALAERGPRYVFGLCGDHVNPIFDALQDVAVELVDMRDERGAGFAAEGWALATGEPGVAIVTAGPGVANVVPAVAECHAWGLPLVVVAGHTPDGQHDALVAGITKRAETVDDTERIPEAIERALHDAAAGRPGPVFLDIPVGVQSRRIDPSAAIRAPVRHHAMTLEALSLPDRAQRPVLIGGSGLWWANAAESLREFAERARVPVFLKGAARGMLPEDHELSFGLPNPLLGPASLAFAEADLFLVIGTRLDVHLAHGAFIGDRTLIHVDIDPDVGNRTSDARHFLAKHAAAQPPFASEDWIAKLTDARRAHKSLLDDRASSIAEAGIHPARLVGEIRRLAGPDTTIVVDAGELGLYAYEMLPAYAPGGLLIGINSPTAGLGQGVPFAIASALAHPARRTILLTGDGSLGFGAMELHTAARRRLPIDVVVGNDGTWGIIAHMQDLIYGRRTATDLGRLDYAALAVGLGCDGDRVKQDADLAPALARRASGRPRLVDVVLDRTAMHPLCHVIAPMFAAE